MLRFNSTLEFDRYIKNLSSNVPDFSIEKKSATKTALINGRQYASFRHLTNLEMKQVNNQKARSLMAAVRRSIYRYIVSHNFDVEIIERYGAAVTKNRELWNKLDKGDHFYLLDIKHCYWRVAYQLGYISKKMYLKYRDNKSVKLARNIALSTLASRKSKVYYRNGQSFWEIKCDSEIMKRVYDNIRYTTYNRMNDIEKALNHQCLGYRVDGIFVFAQSLDKAKQLMRSYHFLFRTEKCIKFDNKQFVNGDGELKVF